MGFFFPRAKYPSKDRPHPPWHPSYDAADFVKPSTVRECGIVPSRKVVRTLLHEGYKLCWTEVRKDALGRALSAWWEARPDDLRALSPSGLASLLQHTAAQRASVSHPAGAQEGACVATGPGGQASL